MFSFSLLIKSSSSHFFLHYLILSFISFFSINIFVYLAPLISSLTSFFLSLLLIYSIFHFIQTHFSSLFLCRTFLFSCTFPFHSNKTFTLFRYFILSLSFLIFYQAFFIPIKRFLIFFLHSFYFVPFYSIFLYLLLRKNLFFSFFLSILMSFFQSIFFIPNEHLFLSTSIFNLCFLFFIPPKLFFFRPF